MNLNNNSLNQRPSEPHTTNGPEFDGPEFEDGHSWEGFVGGCERLGCPDWCSKSREGLLEFAKSVSFIMRERCSSCFGDGSIEIQSGPYWKKCPRCGGTAFEPVGKMAQRVILSAFLGSITILRADPDGLVMKIKDALEVTSQYKRNGETTMMSGSGFSSLAEFPDDLNVLLSLEDSLSNEQHSVFQGTLLKMVDGDPRRYRSASAGLTCEAIMRTLGLWFPCPIDLTSPNGRATIIDGQDQHSH